MTLVEAAIERLDLSEARFEEFWQAILPLDLLLPRTACDELLIRAQDRCTRLLSGSTADEAVLCLENLGFIVAKPQDVFVPPDDAPAVETGSGTGWESSRYQPRLLQLIDGLQKSGVFKEDVIIRVGALRSSSMRTAPYVIVEIPGINKEVILCDEVGEITFVAGEIHGPNFYRDQTKAELKLAPQIQAIKYLSPKQWLGEVTAHLFPRDQAPKVKLDLISMETLRQAILSDPTMTAERWANMKGPQKTKYRAPGTALGLRAVGSRFGIDTSPVGYHDAHLALGEKIFGKGTVISARIALSHASLDEVAAKIRAAGWTPEKWAAMSYADKLTFRIPDTNLGINALATRFGINGNPLHNEEHYFGLGKRIFGDVPAFEVALSRKNDTPEQIIGRILSSGITDEIWAGMTTKNRMQYRVPDLELGITALARKLGVPGEPAHRDLDHYKLGLTIFKDSPILLEKLRWETASPSDLVEHILSSGITPDGWLQMNQQKRVSWQVPGTSIGIEALATRLGCSLRPFKYYEDYLELGEKIFGGATVISRELALERATPAELAQMIRASGMTAEIWASMSWAKLRRFKVPGTEMGMTALATRFGLQGNPYKSAAAMVELGRKIFES
jgi:hypothetical protein